MVLAWNKDKMKLLAYLIVIFTFGISLSFPLFLQFVAPYAAPTSIYAVKTLENNNLPTIPVSELGGYWASATEVEADFPAPSLIVSVFILVLGVPKEFAMFLPITGAANLIYFVLARKVLCSRHDTKSYGLLFSALFYAFTTFSSLHANYIGRATLGETFFAYFLFLCVLFLSQGLSGSQKRSWFVLTLLNIFVIQYTYYTSIVSVLVFAMAMIVMSFIIPLFKWHKGLSKWSISFKLTVVVITASILILNPFFTRFAYRYVSLESLASNVIQYIKVALRIEGQTRVLGLGEVDLLTNMLQRILTVLKYAGMSSIFIALYIYRPKRRVLAHEPAWSFFLVLFVSSLGELSYLVYAPTFPFRHLVKYGFISLLYIAEDLTFRFTHGIFQISSCKFHISDMLGQRCYCSQKRIIAVITLLIISLSCLGSFRIAWYYGQSGAKPFGLNEVLPVSHFFLTYSPSDAPIVLTGDIFHTACIFFITSIHDSDNISPEPLGKDAVTLYYSFESGAMKEFLTRLRERNIKYLIIVENGRAIFGGVWGYRIIPPKSSTLQESILNLIYNDGQCKLFGRIY